MSETQVKVVVDLSKPKGQRESIIPLTDEEIAEREVMAQEAEAQRLVDEAEAQAKADAKESGIAKLSALGLSADEISAITGG